VKRGAVQACSGAKRGAVQACSGAKRGAVQACGGGKRGAVQACGGVKRRPDASSLMLSSWVLARSYLVNVKMVTGEAVAPCAR
jgi:hypothetical protein